MGNSGDEKTPEKGARIAGLVAKLQKSGLNIEQIVNAKHAARQMRFVASKPTMNFSGSARDGEERPFPGHTAAYSDATRQIDANSLPSNAVHSSKKLRALGTKLRALQAKENKLLDEDENADTDSVVAAMTLVQADIDQYWRDFEKAEADKYFGGNHCRRRLTGLAARFERHLRQ